MKACHRLRDLIFFFFFFFKFYFTSGVYEGCCHYYHSLFIAYMLANDMIGSIVYIQAIVYRHQNLLGSRPRDYH